MKKILSSVLCLAMLLSMGTTAFASNISTDGGSQDVTVSYGMSQSFVVTIPSSINIADVSEIASLEVSASNVVIPHGTVLEIVITGDDYVSDWELIDTAENTNKLRYAILAEDTTVVRSGDVVLSVASGEAPNSTVSEDLAVAIMENVTKAGSYTDTLTFTVSVEDTSGGLMGTEIINFKISGASHQAEKGMTWAQWVESEYNTYNLILSETSDGTPCLQKTFNGNPINVYLHVGTAEEIRLVVPSEVIDTENVYNAYGLD